MSVASVTTQPATATATATATAAATAAAAAGGAASTAVFVGVDTHQRTHHAAVIDAHHRRLGDRGFPATAAGYRQLHAWAASHGRIETIGVESTGSYGAGLTTYLLTEGVEVVEVNRSEKTTRVKHGKSDPIDAFSAAEQTLTGRATARPKIKTGVVEAIRNLKVPRDAAEDRTRAYAQLRDLITTAPAELRDDLIALTSAQRVTKAAALRPDPARLHEPAHAARHALRTLARRITALSAEIAEADKILAVLVKQATPTLLAMRQVGTQTAAQLVITAGENIDRMASEATFARLTGVAPLPASSGKTNRHRLNRGGDRQANSALYMIVVGRMSSHPETIAYVQRRSAENKTTPEIIRCLKRHLARSIYRALRHDLMTT